MGALFLGCSSEVQMMYERAKEVASQLR